jgi:ABC-2 type transport system ATP-binding protein
MSPTVSVQSLHKSYGALTAVDGVSFEALPGEIFGILGPNGAGKTTTIECTVGLRAPDSGTVSLAGFDARKSPRQVKQRIGVTLQATTLPDKITPREALRLFASFYDEPEAPDELIARFSLAEKADAKFETLSGGQKQRVAIALAVINRPAVLFLDEPTAGLDPQARRELHEVIRAARAAGQTVVLTTHYIEEAQALCDRIAVIDRGRVIARGTPGELVAGAKALPRVAFTSARAVGDDRLGKLAGVTAVRSDGASATLTTSVPPQTIIDLVKLLDADPGNDLVDLQIHKPSLEDVFIELTGRSLRD